MVKNLKPEKKSIAIVGAGAAGLFAGSYLTSKPNVQSGQIMVDIYEKTKTPGNKLMLSGSGRCNISHNQDVEKFLSHYGERGRFLKHALYRFGPTYLADFCHDRGIALSRQGNNKIFPVGKALALRQALVDSLTKGGIKVRLNTPISQVTQKNARFILSNGQKASGSYDAILLCAGGKSYPHTGSEGNAYHLALGHHITELTPALTPVYIKNFPLALAAGISFAEIPIRIYRCGRKIYENRGAVLITHKGFSGPAILDASRLVQAGDTIMLNFSSLPTQDECLDLLQRQKIRSSKKNLLNVSDLLPIPRKLMVILMQMSGVPQDMRWASISNSQIQKLSHLICGYEFTIAQKGSYKVAMATSGGIDTKQIHSQTMMSRLYPGLFFCGEYMDIDGDSGGYNLQAAFSTACLASQSCLDYLS